MRTTSITLCLVLASFGVSAKILADPDLTYQANKTCAKRDVLELKVPLEAALLQIVGGDKLIIPFC
ncbi:TPA: hypothetical protein RRT09_005430 [Klebsiella pneumoniae]|nr:hypothetical protein [Klebsiella pneumoniae]